MPKIIENLQSKLIEEAKKQIEEAGYGAMTIRSVAKACGVGVGTVYNYFSSKEELVATHLLEDWNRCIAAIRFFHGFTKCQNRLGQIVLSFLQLFISCLVICQNRFCHRFCTYQLSP